MSIVFYMVLFFVIIYFMMIRPNSKQQSERRTMLNSVRLKDEVVTIGGVHGRVTKINEEKDTFMLQVAPNVEIEFLKSSVQSIENRDWKEEYPEMQKKGLFGWKK